jgi:hypothetical protein
MTKVNRFDGSNQSRHCSSRRHSCRARSSCRLEHLRGDLVDPLVDERLAAADRDDGSGALDGRVDAFLDREAGAVRLVLADLPAADAGDVAREGRLEHEDERIALAFPLLRATYLPMETVDASGNFIQPTFLSVVRVPVGEM